MVYKNLRVRFEKTGMLKYISHLDLCRTMRTAFNRAKTPVRYSEGYNPHPRMTFSPPLPLGAQSVCEYMDLQVPEDTDPQSVCRALDRVTAPELRFTEAYFSESSLTDAAYAEYEMILSDPVTIRDAEQVLKAPPHIFKKTKKGTEKEVDPGELIHSYRVLEKDGAVCVRAVLCCSSDRYLNPEHLAALFGAPEYEITRCGFFFSDGKVFQ